MRFSHLFFPMAALCVFALAACGHRPRDTGLYSPNYRPPRDENFNGGPNAILLKYDANHDGSLERAKDAVLESAVQQGKVVALEASVLEKMTVAEMTEHVKKLPVTVPLAARTPKTMKPDPAANDMMAQFNAITDPAKRAQFYKENKAKLGG